VRCPRCGNENSEENRFCGMCGAKLLPEAAAVTSAPAGVASTSAQTTGTRSPAPPSAAAPLFTRPQSATTPRASAPLSQDPPAISGPSFLGLNDPAPRKRASLSTDSHSSSRNLDYLLEDEEEHRGGGAGKFFLILLALALAVGFGYLRWKNQGVPWLHLGPSKPAAAAQNSDSTDAIPPSPDANAAPTAPTRAPSTTAPAQPATPSEGQPATQTAAQPAADSPAASAPAAANPAPNSDTGNPPTPTAPATGDATAGSSDASNPSADSATAPPTTAAKEPAKESAPAASEAPPPTPKPKKAAPAPKPHAGVSSTSPSDSVSEAKKYIYGRGVVQDCERGMRLLKPAAAQANTKAMIEMGALYSAGLCTPHDLPTAYRWFAMALRKEPDNQAIQTDLQKLWSEMTQPERQLAIKLSQ